MTIPVKSLKFWLRVGLGLLLIVSVQLLITSKASAELPVRPQPGLPVRPSIPQTPLPPEVGARIMLQVDSIDESLWTVVQWLDGEGVGHDVEGWRGQFQPTGYVRWFVEEKDFGKGPFIWKLYHSPTHEALWNSQPFYLPTRPNEVVTLTSELTPTLSINVK